jgi:hypothetical protein
MGYSLTFASFLFVVTSLTCLNAQVVEKNSPKIAIKANAISAHMAFLSDDLLEGREAATRGEELAALYIKSHFEAANIEPAGVDDGYYQRFSTRKSNLDLGSVSFLVTNTKGEQKSFINGDTVAVFSTPHEEYQNIKADLVFAGSGIIAPEFSINDYAHIDVKGKVAVVLGGPAAFLPASEAAHYGSVTQQRITASRKGAIGLIVLYTPALEARWQFSRFKSILDRDEIDWLGPDMTTYNDAPNLRIRAYMEGEAAESLFEGTDTSLAELIEEANRQSPKGFPLKTRIQFKRHSLHNDDLGVTNVVALTEGSDPILKNEVVVVSAHYDHLGIGEAVNGDAIYNGAGDNALGTAVLIELSQRIARMSIKPKRSILFLAVSAEEKGLIGSDYFAQFPTTKNKSIVANINVDGGLPFYDFSDVIGFGVEHTQLFEHLTSASKQLGITVTKDPFPEQGIFTRSDQYSFAKRGIPSVFLFTGFTSTDGVNEGQRYWEYMTTEHGHKPSDDLSLGWDYQVIAKFADLVRRFVVETANAKQAPLWYENSRLGQLFSPDSKKAIYPAHLND